MVKQGAEIFDSNSEWSRLCELATEINNEKLNYYIELGKKVINRMK